VVTVGVVVGRGGFTDDKSRVFFLVFWWCGRGRLAVVTIGVVVGRAGVIRVVAGTAHLTPLYRAQEPLTFFVVPNVPFLVTSRPDETRV